MRNVAGVLSRAHFRLLVAAVRTIELAVAHLLDREAFAVPAPEARTLGCRKQAAARRPIDDRLDGLLAGAQHRHRHHRIECAQSAAMLEESVRIQSARGSHADDNAALGGLFAVTVPWRKFDDYSGRVFVVVVLPGVLMVVPFGVVRMVMLELSVAGQFIELIVEQRLRSWFTVLGVTVRLFGHIAAGPIEAHFKAPLHVDGVQLTEFVVAEGEAAGLLAVDLIDSKNRNK